MCLKRQTSNLVKQQFGNVSGWKIFVHCVCKFILDGQRISSSLKLDSSHPVSFWKYFWYILQDTCQIIHWRLNLKALEMLGTKGIWPVYLTFFFFLVCHIYWISVKIDENQIKWDCNPNSSACTSDIQQEIILKIVKILLSSERRHMEGLVLWSGSFMPSF